MTAQSRPAPRAAPLAPTGEPPIVQRPGLPMTTASLRCRLSSASIVAIGLLLVWNSREAFSEFGPGSSSGRRGTRSQGSTGRCRSSSARSLPVADRDRHHRRADRALTAIFLAELAPTPGRDPADVPDRAARGDPERRHRPVGRLHPQPVPRPRPSSRSIVESLGWIPIFAGPSYGIGLFSAGIILTIMILPTIVAISREVITAVPTSQREAMARPRRDALGDDPTERSCRSPARGSSARSSSGPGRALGETMAVTMVIGNAQEHPTRPVRPGPDDRLARSPRPSTRRRSASRRSSADRARLIAARDDDRHERHRPAASSGASAAEGGTTHWRPRRPSMTRPVADRLVRRTRTGRPASIVCDRGRRVRRRVACVGPARRSHLLVVTQRDRRPQPATC
mgnify:CR=1 FL=1